ncbi:putative quinol monooxygenase [Gordonia sp. DT218]|uniref:putative quinol monooxygenase n=1 Tax=Gordonia sp. DT218 TaxID=3416659 RepID=UPI003CF36F83
MIFIVAKWPVKPEFVEQWPDLVEEFTQATRAEVGNKWFEWSRSLDEPATYVLVEAFDDDAAEAHVTSEHFRKATAELPKYLARTPDIVNATIDQEAWSELGEMAVGGQ